MKHIIIVLTLVLLVLPFQQNLVKAETANPIQQDYLQYDGFQKRYHDFLGELSYYMATSYDSNDHYFRENVETFQNALGQIYQVDGGYFVNEVIPYTADALAKPISLLSSANDLRKFMWEKIKGYFTTEKPYGDPVVDGATVTIMAPEGFYFAYNGNKFSSWYIKVIDNRYNLGGVLRNNGQEAAVSSWNTVLEDVNSYYNMALGGSVDGFNKFFSRLLDGQMYTIHKVEDDQVIINKVSNVPSAITNIYNRTINNFNDGEKFNEDYTPDVLPMLVCPNSNVDLTYQDGSFYTKERSNQNIVINADETVTYNGAECALDFKFPVLELTLAGDLTADGESLIKLPELPSDDDYDFSILTYIQNSYNYATSVVNTGVNGLKSIIAGTAGLVTFTGSMFGFLPPEIVTLFVSGFAIALGLWVFKR